MLFKKTVFVFCISIIFIMTFTGCTSNKTATGQVEAEITLGYDGTIKISDGNPLVAKIKNNGVAFSGELQIEVEESAMSKIIVAQPFEIAENATKEIILDVPLRIIQKEFKVSIKDKDDLLYEETIKANKVLSPERKVMAVITDTPDAYRFLENVKLYMYNPYSEKYAMSTYPTGNTAEMETENIEVLFFDNFDQLDSEEKLSFFNYIYIGHNQSLNISEEVEGSLQSWIASGNSFIIETGADFKKTNSILPISLNPIKISKTASIPGLDLWGGLEISDSFDVAISDDGESLDNMIHNGVQLLTKTKVQNGSILTLLVNMTQEPIASWNSKAIFIQDILASYSNNDMQNIDPYYVSQYQYMVQQVPSDKKTPYLFMIIALGLYVIIAAPVLYFVLKKMDKRDYAWVSIPALALICILALYLFGSGTRYTKGIMNSISVLTADTNNDFMNISSDIMIFNNKKDDLNIEWSPDEHIKINSDMNDPYFSYTYDPNMSKQVKTLNGKFTLGNPRTYEKYNTSLWSSVYVTAEKTIPFSVEKMVTMELKGNDISIHVKNTTPYDLKDAFIQWGQGYIFIGNLAPGEETTVNEQLDKAMYPSFETFLDKEMGLKPFDYSKQPTAEEQKNIRKMELLLQRYVYEAYQYAPTQGGYKNLGIEAIKLCALNNQDVGYEIKVNKEEAEKYATNFIEITSALEFEKGSTVTIPSGIIMPAVNYYLDDKLQAIGGYEYQSYDQFYRFYEQGIVTMAYHVPDSINMTKAHIQMGDVFDEQAYYSKTNGQGATPKEVQYLLLNPETGLWEEIEKTTDITGEHYLNAEGNLTIKVDLRDEQSSKGNYSYANMMKAPSITIEGSVE